MRNILTVGGIVVLVAAIAIPVLAHGPGALAVHVPMDAAGERKLARAADALPAAALLHVLSGVERFDLQARFIEDRLGLCLFLVLHDALSRMKSTTARDGTSSSSRNRNIRLRTASAGASSRGRSGGSRDVLFSRMKAARSPARRY